MHFDFVVNVVCRKLPFPRVWRFFSECLLCDVCCESVRRSCFKAYKVIKPLVRADIKLFIAMIPVEAGEKDIADVFEPFGNVEEVYILLDKDRKSRGCAFVKYTRNDEAVNAIQALHRQYTMQVRDDFPPS